MVSSGKIFLDDQAAIGSRRRAGSDGPITLPGDEDSRNCALEGLENRRATGFTPVGSLSPRDGLAESAHGEGFAGVLIGGVAIVITL